MPDIKEKLKVYFTNLLSHPVCLSNTIMLALTTGFEQAWENVLFKCPEKPPSEWYSKWYSSNQLYSVMFLLAPAVALWALGMLGSNLAWRTCQGYNHRSEDTSEPRSFFSALLRTFVVPLVWVFVALMDGDFYACYNYLPSCSEDSPSYVVEGVNCTQNVTAWQYVKKIESQLIAWVFALLVLMIGTFVVFCGRARSKRTYFPELYSNKLRKVERLLIEKSLMEQAEKDGKRNVGAFMMKEEVTAFMMKEEVTASDWASVCREKTKQELKTEAQLSKEEVLYHSPLSEFMNEDAANKQLLTDYDKAEAAKAAPNTPEGNAVQTQNPETR